MRQLAVVPAGGQPWFPQVAAASFSAQTQQVRFVYGSTLAIYLFQYLPQGQRENVRSEVQLQKVLSEFESNMTAIAW